MGTLEFMNQDGEWEKFPSDEELALIKEDMTTDLELYPMNPEIQTICHLCNEPFPMELIKITGGNPTAGYTWSCPKCHAVSGIGKA